MQDCLSTLLEHLDEVIYHLMHTREIDIPKHKRGHKDEVMMARLGALMRR
jgi:hypothetical protein